MQNMPIGEIRFLDEEEVKKFSLDMIQDEAEYGFALVVDIEYPESLHLDHNAFPLAPYSKDITYDDLSFYSQTCVNFFSQKRSYKSKKLVASVENKYNYVCQGTNLKFYVAMGLKITKIHKIIQYRQGKFLLPFVKHCYQKRASALTIVYKLIYKYLPNSLFGKFIENVEGRTDTYIVFNRQEALKRLSEPRYISSTICSPEMALIHMRKKKIVLNMAYHVGFAILEAAKLHMQKLFYLDLKPAFNRNISVCMTDTDSYCFLVFAENEDAALSKIEHIMDFSNYDKKHIFYNESKKSVPGFLKNECPNQIIKRIVALRSKCYAIETVDFFPSTLKLKVTCKGVKMSAKANIHFDSFLQCIHNLTGHSETQFSIQSKSHNLKLIKSEKQCFNSLNDKVWQSCASHSYAYGSFLIERQKRTGECFFCVHKILR